MTETHQPLDNKLFGILKAKSPVLTNKICEYVMKNFKDNKGDFVNPIEPPWAVTKREAVVIIEFGWEDIKESQVIDAWHDAIGSYLNTVRFENKEDFVENDFQSRLADLLQRKHFEQLQRQRQMIQQQQMQEQQMLMQQQQMQQQQAYNPLQLYLLKQHQQNMLIYLNHIGNNPQQQTNSQPQVYTQLYSQQQYYTLLPQQPIASMAIQQQTQPKLLSDNVSNYDEDHSLENNDFDNEDYEGASEYEEYDD